MPLDPATEQRIDAHIKNKCKLGVCYVCGTSGPWHRGDFIQANDRMTPGKGRVYVPVWCSQCGSTILIDAGVIGLTDKDFSTP